MPLIDSAMWGRSRGGGWAIEQVDCLQIRATEPPSLWRLGALPLLQTSNPGKGQCLSSALLRKVMFARTESAFRIGLPTVVLGVAGLSFMMNRTYLRC